MKGMELEVLQTACSVRVSSKRAKTHRATKSPSTRSPSHRLIWDFLDRENLTPTYGNKIQKKYIQKLAGNRKHVKTSCQAKGKIYLFSYTHVEVDSRSLMSLQSCVFFFLKGNWTSSHLKTFFPAFIVSTNS